MFEPNDNQGLRYRQTQWLLTLERYEELDALFAAYEDDAAASFAYTRALAAFRRDSDTAATRTLLGQARERNAHVPRSQGGPRRPGDAGTDRAPIRMHPSRTMTAGGKLSRAAAAVLRA